MRQLCPINQTVTAAAPSALPLLREVDIDYDRGVPRFSGGNPVLVSGLAAVKSWAWRALKTTRYEHSCFTWDYGCELRTLIGQPYGEDLRRSEAVRCVREALTVCPYIAAADVELDGLDGSTVHIPAALTTVYGEVPV